MNEQDFSTRRMARPVSRSAGIYDYELCADERELRETIGEINARGYALISVTQSEGVYTVFFRRSALG